MNKPERLTLNNTNRNIGFLKHYEGEMDLNPPYQRGDVWGVTRRRSLIRSLMLGVPIPALVINDRFSATGDMSTGYAVIDGKQRITAFLMFYRDELKVDGELFGLEGMVTFSELPENMQRHFSCLPIPVCEAQIKTIDGEREVFDLINFGGLAQGESDNPCA